ALSAFIAQVRDARKAGLGSPLKITGRCLAGCPAGNLLTGSLILLSTGVVDMLNDLVFHYDVSFSTYSFFIFTMGAALILARRFGGLFNDLSLSNARLEALSGELRDQVEKVSALHKSSLRFVPAQFMENLGVPDITLLKLGDSIQRDFTILFFDVRSFSIYSEMMTTEENFRFINQVLGAAGPVTRKYGGFVDKYAGDSAMVLFEDPAAAVRAGIELYRRVVLDRQSGIRVGGDGISIGIGLHTGAVMLGIIGENERLSGTVISKAVNLASRIESLTKQTGSGMLITRETINRIKNPSFEYRFIGMIQAAGMNEVTGVFEVLDVLPEKQRAPRLATKKVFESGVRKYHTRDYEAAVKRFRKIVDHDPGDICAANCLREAEARLEDPGLPSFFTFDRK
ncbi:MAG: adenylate/guanylate cyclase domain-containing protein, partial [Spirochaetaceae bacterium]|nr:adenylate/guanylate cyclase domain-containing protein [Spirochaetaceae bacterium]